MHFPLIDSIVAGDLIKCSIIHEKAPRYTHAPQCCTFSASTMPRPKAHNSDGIKVCVCVCCNTKVWKPKIQGRARSIAWAEVGGRHYLLFLIHAKKQTQTHSFSNTRPRAIMERWEICECRVQESVYSATTLLGMLIIVRRFNFTPLINVHYLQSIFRHHHVLQYNSIQWFC